MNCDLNLRMLVFSLVFCYEKVFDFYLVVNIMMWFSVVFLLVYDLLFWYLWGFYLVKLSCYGVLFIVVVIFLDYMSFWLIVLFFGSCGFFVFFGSFLVRLYEKLS